MEKLTSAVNTRMTTSCPNCNGYIVKLFQAKDHSSSRRVITHCGHCQASVAIVLSHKVMVLAVQPTGVMNWRGLDDPHGGKCLWNKNSPVAHPSTPAAILRRQLATHFAE